MGRCYGLLLWGGGGMNEKQLQRKVNKIRKNMKLFDSIVHHDYKTGKGSLRPVQVKIVQEMFSLLRTLGWQLKFNNYKELKYSKKATYP